MGRVACLATWKWLAGVVLTDRPHSFNLSTDPHWCNCATFFLLPGPLLGALLMETLNYRMSVHPKLTQDHKTKESNFVTRSTERRHVLLGGRPFRSIEQAAPCLPWFSLWRHPESKKHEHTRVHVVWMYLPTLTQASWEEQYDPLAFLRLSGTSVHQATPKKKNHEQT